MSGKVKSSCISLSLICIYFILPICLSNYKIMVAMITMRMHTQLNFFMQLRFTCTEIP